MNKVPRSRLNKNDRASFEMLRDAVSGAPRQHVLNWLIPLIIDDPRIDAGRIETFSNKIGHEAHLKGRNNARD